MEKINNLIGSIIEYANSRNNGGRASVIEAKRELSCLMQLNLTISYSKEHTPILFSRNINNDDDNNIISPTNEQSNSLYSHSKLLLTNGQSSSAQHTHSKTQQLCSGYYKNPHRFTKAPMIFRTRS